MKRRKFLQITLAFLGSTAFASLLYPLARVVIPKQAERTSARLVLSRKEIPVGTTKRITFNDTPAIVINHPSSGLLAFPRVCTHLGCLVDYDKGTNRLVCPCHAGSFDLEGNVVSGPPPKPLLKLPLRVDGDTIVIG